MDYPGWTVETTHPVDPEAEDYCALCASLVAPTMAFAINMESPSHSHVQTDDGGVPHRVTVRQV